MVEMRRTRLIISLTCVGLFTGLYFLAPVLYSTALINVWSLQYLSQIRAALLQGGISLLPAHHRGDEAEFQAERDLMEEVDRNETSKGYIFLTHFPGRTGRELAALPAKTSVIFMR